MMIYKNKTKLFFSTLKIKLIKQKYPVIIYSNYKEQYMVLSILYDCDLFSFQWVWTINLQVLMGKWRWNERWKNHMNVKYQIKARVICSVLCVFRISCFMVLSKTISQRWKEIFPEDFSDLQNQMKSNLTKQRWINMSLCVYRIIMSSCPTALAVYSIFKFIFLFEPI